MIYRIYLASCVLVAVLMIVVSVHKGVVAQEAPKPDCASQLATMRAYADALRGDRDQKEGALIEYVHQVQVLQAELAKLKAPAAPQPK